jgi:hypothetical protein
MKTGRVKCSLLLFSYLFVFIFQALAQHSKPDTLFALPINEKIKIDGQLKEDAWQQAMKISNFTQRQQVEGAPATEKTEVAVLYDDNNLYFGIWAYDSEPDKIIAKSMKRDFSWGSEDNFEIILSTYNDNRNAFLFVTNPNGALADALISDEGRGFNKDWNGVWDVRVKINDQGWYIEMVIPLSTLKFKTAEDLVWGLNFERNIRRKREQDMWQGWSRNYELETISQGGKLAGLHDLQNRNKLELKPYVIGGIGKNKGEKVDYIGNVGGDVNYNITPTMKINLTFNTDFAQVESDRQQINLSRFALYYPEKREFFLEGRNQMEMDMSRGNQVYYSRRIGIDPNVGEIRIIAGGKMIGKANRTNIGVMSLQTLKKDSIPTTNYSVIRIKQDIGKQSNIGIITTAKINKDHYNYVYGADANYVTSKFLKDKNFSAGIAWAQSQTDTITSSKNNTYKAYVSSNNDLWSFRAGIEGAQEHYNPEMGFLRRSAYTAYNGEMKWKPRPKFLSKFIYQLEFKPIEIMYYQSDLTKQTESIWMEFRPLGFETVSGEWFEFNFQRMYDRLYEDFDLLGHVIPAGEYWDNRWEIQLDTYRGRRFSVGTFFNWGDFYTGNRTRVHLEGMLNVNKHMNISADWRRNIVHLEKDSFTTDELGGRIEYAFNARVYTSVFGQWNNEDQEIILNYRLNWNPKPGAYFYFVINQEVGTAGPEGWVNNSITVMAKLIWRFAI